jgi:hypothetical protein
MGDRTLTQKGEKLISRLRMKGQLRVLCSLSSERGRGRRKKEHTHTHTASFPKSFHNETCEV